ncbi:undecaprenyl-diphosphatase [Burkholderia glumae]|uniref:undecaprenyl-diphosphatase n=1 Tax=Burkholderia glumae TaxID=337 RepID=UPI0020371803|nr:undecaprenyl-diphosphatase [Burkholderia glumae]MCM2494586.1 undecaprenyl-diphosphatase [Burkholderia glumae]MCM2545456.1 undecaprenyl-diphosphatase [Burkholderia glumae]
MPNLDLAMFSALNAGRDPQPVVAHLAVFAANWLVGVVPLLLAALWLTGTRAMRRAAIAAAVSAGIALLLAQLMPLCWYAPRPFALGIGTQLIAHAPDSAFPSHHMAFVWSVAARLWLARTTRALGAATAIDALLVAWARVYAGIHWPLDMLGGALTGSAAALLAQRYGGALVARIERAGEALRTFATGSPRGR